MWPPLGALTEGLVVVDLPLAVAFRGVTHRELALIRGPVGWGEFGPFLEYPPVEAARWLMAAIEAAYDGWPAAVRRRLPVNATVPAVPADSVPGILARFPGCTTAKVKVAEHGQTLGDDLARVAAVRDIMGPAGKVRVDANGGWSHDAAADALRELASFGLEYAEQPCAEVQDLARLRITLARRRIDVLVAADESIRKAEDPMSVARLGAADLLVVKVAPLGGVRRALDIVRASGLPAVVSSALDSSVGIAAGCALASALPELPFACGLGTALLLGADVAAKPLVPVDGWISAGAVEPNPQLLQRYAAPSARVAWWRERLARSYEHLPRALA